MYKRLNFKITGISPLICHNGHLADPLNSFAKQLKEVSSKRSKTESDYEAMAKIEWFGGLYVDDENRPVIPGTNIEAMMIEGGKKQKLGQAFKAGLISDGNWPIEYDGPKTAEQLWAKSAQQFADRRGVKVGMATVFRTRPIFRKWSLSFSVDYLPDVLNESQVKSALATAGRIIGLCDYTPRHGRFEVA